MSSLYLTRAQVAERYPISVHTLAKLASEGKGPRFYKPTDKCLYRPEDIEAWIEASVVLPSAHSEQPPRVSISPPPHGGRGRARALPAKSSGRPLKSLPPTKNSWLLRRDPK